MKRKIEKVPGFDEIIFENRNKNYGAYVLRKKYAKTECLSILFGSILFTAITILLTFSTEKPGHAKDEGTIVILNLDPVIPDLNKIKIEEPPRPQPVAIKPKYQVPVIVEDSAAKSASFAPVDLIIDSIKDGDVNEKLAVTPRVDPVVPVSNEPLIWVPEMPVFPGGDEALLKYVNANVTYPEEAIENKLQGMVIVRFVVSPDGSIQKTEILRSVHPVLDREAERVVKGMPRWKPGKQNGVPVSVWFSIPVSFKLNYR